MINRLDRLGSHRIGVGDVIGPYRVVAKEPDSFRAIHVQTRHEVLLEVWPATATPLVEVALRHMRGLDHPGILAIVESGTLRDGPHWITTEIPRGEGLHQMLVGRTMRAERVVTLVRDVSEVLCYAHVRGVTHGALRPSSITMTGGEQPITICGWSNISTPRAPSPQRGVFEAPEPIYDAPADVYSLGVIAYRALTGVFPRGQVTGIPGAPPPLATLIAAMLVEDPTGRPTAGEVRDQVGRMLGETAEEVIEIVEIGLDDLIEEALQSTPVTPRFGVPKWTPTGLAPVTPASPTFRDDFDESPTSS